MNHEMVNTKNVMAFHRGLEVLRKGTAGRNGMMLVTGKPGTGKTETCKRQAVNSDAVYVRCRYVDTPRNLLSSIVTELGEEPRGYTGKLFNQAKDHLLAQPQPKLIILDEVDYLVANKGMIEIVRDLNDESNAPIIITGMEHLGKKLQRFPHLYDRIRAVVHFELFEKSEIKTLASKICEAQLDDSAIEYTHNRSGGKLRLTMDIFEMAERLAKQNNLKVVTEEHIKQAWEKEKRRTRA